MDLDGWRDATLTLAIQPTPGFLDIENLALRHQGQDEFIRYSVAPAVWTDSFFPRAVTLNAFSGTDTNKTVHSDHHFYRSARSVVGLLRHHVHKLVVEGGKGLEFGRVRD